MTELVIGGTYKHYQGDAYKLLEITTRESDGSQWCVYQGYKPDSEVCRVQLEEFTGTIPYTFNGDLIRVPRFAFLYLKADCK